MKSILYNDGARSPEVMKFGSHLEATHWLSRNGWEQWQEPNHKHIWQHIMTKRLRFLEAMESSWLLYNHGTIEI